MIFKNSIIFFFIPQEMKYYNIPINTKIFCIHTFYLIFSLPFSFMEYIYKSIVCADLILLRY